MKKQSLFVCVVGLLLVGMLGGCVASEPTRTAELQMVTHLTAGLPEQDVYIVKDGSAEGEVMRATIEELALPEVQSAMLYSSAQLNNHDPFLATETPFGPFPKGEELGFTMAEWLAATGSGTYTVQGNDATVEFEFANLIPNGLYTLWSTQTKLPPEPTITSIATGSWDGSDNTFVADADGNGSISVDMAAMPDTTDTHLSIFAIAYHSDKMTHGGYHGDFGRITHVQAFVAVPSPSADVWQTELTHLAAAE